MRSLFILNMPLCTQNWLEPVVAQATGLGRTWKIGGQVLTFSLIGLGRFLPANDRASWAAVSSVLDKCEGKVAQDFWNPHLVRRFVQENPDKAQAVLLRPSFEEVVFRNWERGWPSIFRARPDLFNKIKDTVMVPEGPARELYRLQTALPAWVEGFHDLYEGIYGGLDTWELDALLENPESLFPLLEGLGYPETDPWDWTLGKGCLGYLKQRTMERHTAAWGHVGSMVEKHGVPNGW